MIYQKRGCLLHASERTSGQCILVTHPLCKQLSIRPSKTAHSQALLLKIAFVLFILTSAIFTASCAAEQYIPDPLGLVIVMHPDIVINTIDDEELIRLFTGKSRRLPDGARAALASFTPESSFFNERMLNLSDAEVAALGSRLRFSRRTTPPRTFDSVGSLLQHVKTTPNALDYLPVGASREGVRVISNLPRRVAGVHNTG